jgi:hypothetical protein
MYVQGETASTAHPVRYCSSYIDSAGWSLELMDNDAVLLVFRTDGINIITDQIAVSGGNSTYARIYILNLWPFAD